MKRQSKKYMQVEKYVLAEDRFLPQNWRTEEVWFLWFLSICVVENVVVLV